MLLKGKKAIITGGSRGIGKEIVLLFLKQGAIVYFIDLVESEYLKEMQEAAAASKSNVIFKQADVAAEEQITAVIKDIIKESEGIDILVNNAGITRDGLIFRMPLENWQKAWELDPNDEQVVRVGRLLGAD